MRRSAERAARAERLFEVPLIVAALLVLPSLAMLDPELGEPWNAIGLGLDAAIWLAFAVELVVMLLIVPSPKAWLRANPLSPVIVILSPPFAPAAFAVLRLLRLLRLLTLIRVARVAKRVFCLDGIKAGAIITALTIIIGGAAFAAVEPGGDLDSVDGLWWALTTVTTVGYGDIVPTTDSGRIIGLIVMSVGISFVALVTGAAAERFLNVSDQEEAADNDRRQMLVEVKAMRSELASLRHRLEKPSP